MPKKHAPEIRIAAVKAYRNGEATEAIAARYGVSEGAILYWKRLAGVARGRNRKCAPDLPDEFVLRAWEKSEYRVTTCARALGVGTERLKRNLLRLGLHWKVWKPRPLSLSADRCRLCDFPITDEWLCTASEDDPTVHATCALLRQGRAVVYEELGQVAEFTNDLPVRARLRAARGQVRPPADRAGTQTGRSRGNGK